MAEAVLDADFVDLDRAVGIGFGRKFVACAPLRHSARPPQSAVRPISSGRPRRRILRSVRRHAAARRPKTGQLRSVRTHSGFLRWRLAGSTCPTISLFDSWFCSVWNMTADRAATELPEPAIPSPPRKNWFFPRPIPGNHRGTAILLPFLLVTKRPAGATPSLRHRN